MTPTEFAPVMAYAEAACGKTLSKEQAAVYFDLLGDLPRDALMAGVKRAALEHRYATVPPAGMIRELAMQSAVGTTSDLPAAKAWELAWRAIGRMDLEVPGSVDRAMSGLPSIVVDAIRAFGIPSLVYGREPVTVVRAQFTKIFEQLSAVERRHALLPGTLREQIQRIGNHEEASRPLRIAQGAG